MDADCFKLLSSKYGPRDLKGIYLKRITNYFQLANSITSLQGMAGTILGTYGIGNNGIPIILSDVAFAGGTKNLRLDILHEFAHLVGAIPQDGNDPTGSASKANSATIAADCAKTLNAK
jgi:hypothetical protein